MTNCAHRKAYLQSFPILASILGQKYGIRVEIGGEKASTDGETIRLPALPQEMSEDLFVLGNGYLDHEAAHLLASDFETLHNASLSSLAHLLCNIVEDIRVERHISKLYPGCRTNFEKLYTYMVRTQKQEVSENLGGILKWLLTSVCSREYPSIPFPLKAFREALEPRFSNLLLLLEGYLDWAETFCTSTETSIQWARDVEKLLTTYFNNSAPQQNLGNSCGKGASGENGTASDRKEDKKSQKEPVLGVEDAKDDGKTSPKEAVPPTKSISHNSLPPTGINPLEQSLAFDEDLPLPVGEAVKAILEELISTYGYSKKMEVAKVKAREDIDELPSREQEEASRTIRALSMRLSGLLQTQTLNRVALGRRGKVDCSRLYRLQTGNSKVFRRNTEKNNINTAIHILLDSSGSMMPQMELACAACYAVAASLWAIPGVNVAVTSFYGYYAPEEERIIPYVTPILRHGERMHRNFFIKADGDTPMGESLWWVYQEGALLKEKRKIILVLSDGAPDSISETQHALQMGQTLGFEVYGIGIGEGATCMYHLIPESQLIHNIEDLAPAMIHMLQKAMISS